MYTKKLYDILTSNENRKDFVKHVLKKAIENAIFENKLTGLFYKSVSKVIEIHEDNQVQGQYLRFVCKMKDYNEAILGETLTIAIELNDFECYDDSATWKHQGNYIYPYFGDFARHITNFYRQYMLELFGESYAKALYLYTEERKDSTITRYNPDIDMMSPDDRIKYLND